MQQDELMHFGVKGMKWGKRKNDYSIGSSFRYRRYTKAANSAQRDADNLRKNGYKEEAKAVQKVADKNRAKAEASKNNSKSNIKKNALKTSGILAGISVMQTARNYKEAQKALDAMGFGDKILVSQVVTRGAVAAGRAAAIGALGYIGSRMVSDYMKENKQKESS